MMRNAPILLRLVFGIAVVWTVFGVVSFLEGDLYGLGFLLAGLAMVVAALYLPRSWPRNP